MIQALAAAWLAVSAGAVEVTVYNQDLGLVKDERRFEVKRGESEASASDVAARIDPTSVHLRCAPPSVSVLEQDFEYDLATPDKLMQKYLGQEIALERYSGPNGERRETLRGTLLSNSGGRIVSSEGRVYVDPPGNPVLPALAEGLVTRPTLFWKLSADSAGSRDCEISYLTGGLSWQADYVAVIDKSDSRMDLTAWTTVVNESGAAYRDAKLKLVAGNVHRAAPPMRPGAKIFAMAAQAAPEATERPFFEFHLYSVARPTTLRENETKQIELTQASGVPVQKTYAYRGAQASGDAYSDYTRSDPNYGVEGQKKVYVTLAFKNAASSGLGLPLPAGKARVYKADSDGTLQFAGEDAIDHTPKDEEVRLKMGEAFDLVGERARTSYQSDAHHHWFEESFEIKLRNHKDQPVTIAVVEPLYRWSGWKIEAASQKWAKKDAQTIEFSVPVAKDGESAVTYTVKYSW